MQVYINPVLTDNLHMKLLPSGLICNNYCFNLIPHFVLPCFIFFLNGFVYTYLFHAIYFFVLPPSSFNPVFTFGLSHFFQSIILPWDIFTFLLMSNSAYSLNYLEYTDYFFLFSLGFLLLRYRLTLTNTYWAAYIKQPTAQGTCKGHTVSVNNYRYRMCRCRTLRHLASDIRFTINIWFFAEDVALLHYPVW